MWRTGPPRSYYRRESEPYPPSYSTRYSSDGESDERQVVVAIMGATGSGKSTFLTACGGKNFQSGHTLASETKEPIEWTGSYKGVSLTLVDTPGFGDTNLPDSVILEKITLWLQSNFEQGRKINGIIYLHRITDNRMTHIGVKNIKMFKQLCGNDAMHNAILCTSFWDAIDRTTGESREEELRNEYWKNMIGLGATVARHYNTKDSAIAILDKILSQNGVNLQIQKEMASGKKLIDTSAGKLITDDVATREKEFYQMLRQLRLDYEEALQERDIEMKRIIEEEQKRMFDQIRMLEEDKLRLEQKLDDLRAKVDRRQSFSVKARAKAEMLFQKIGIFSREKETLRPFPTPWSR